MPVHSFCVTQMARNSSPDAAGPEGAAYVDVVTRFDAQSTLAPDLNFVALRAVEQQRIRATFGSHDADFSGCGYSSMTLVTGVPVAGI
jgi:hypothetical protein